MKKLVILTCMLALLAVPAWAGPRGGHHGPHGFHHGKFGRPAPVALAPMKHHKHNHIAGFVASLVGSAIGSYVVSSQYQPVNYSNQQCFVMVNQFDNSTITQCVERNVLTPNNYTNILMVN